MAVEVAKTEEGGKEEGLRGVVKQQHRRGERGRE